MAQLGGIATQRGEKGGWLLRSREADEANDSGVSVAPYNGEFAEVLVERQHNLPGVPGMGQDVRVAWIGGPVRNALDLVSGYRERGCDGAGDATVDQNLHAPGL